MYEFCYDYVKPKYGEKAKLCYIDTHMEIDDDRWKQMKFIKTLQKMLKMDLILQIMSQIDHSLNEKSKSNWIKKRLIRGSSHDKTFLD